MYDKDNIEYPGTDHAICRNHVQGMIKNKLYFYLVLGLGRFK